MTLEKEVVMTANPQAGKVGEHAGRKRGMEQVIETVASGIGNGIGWMAEHYVLFGVFLVLWIAFGAGLVASQGSLDQAWATIRGLPLVVQIAVWILFLPVTAGLWVWEASGWNVVVRLVVVAGLAGWNLFMFLPRSGPAPA